MKALFLKTLLLFDLSAVIPTLSFRSAFLFYFLIGLNNSYETPLVHLLDPFLSFHFVKSFDNLIKIFIVLPFASILQLLPFDTFCPDALCLVFIRFVATCLTCLVSFSSFLIVAFTAGQFLIDIYHVIHLIVTNEHIF
jgi:hypothetical protein